MFGFFSRVDEDAYSAEVWGILRKEFDWNTDLFVRFDPYIRHIIKVAIKSKAPEYAAALTIETASVLMRAAEIKNTESPEKLEEKKKYLSYLENELGPLTENCIDRVGLKGSQFVLGYIRSINEQ